MTKINLNDTVKVKLNEYGKKVLKAHIKKWRNILMINAPDGYKIEDAYPIDDDGFNKFQLHQLICIFGENVTRGSMSAFEGNIIYWEQQ